VLILWPADAWFQETIKTPAILAAWFVVYTLALDFYNVAMHARYGQTLGKMVTGVRVLDASGGKLSLRQALIRDSVPMMLSLLAVGDAWPRVFAGLDPYGNGEFTLLFQLQMYGSIAWFAAELLTMLTNTQRRAVHDFLARSVVVRVSAPRARNDTAVA